MPESGRKAAKKSPARSRTAPAARRAKPAAARAGGPKSGSGGEEAAAAPRARARTSGAARGSGASLTIEQTGSGIGCLEAHKRTLRALGLRHPRQRVVRPDNPAIRGMVAAIPHLVRILEG